MEKNDLPSEFWLSTTFTLLSVLYNRFKLPNSCGLVEWKLLSFLSVCWMTYGLCFLKFPLTKTQQSREIFCTPFFLRIELIINTSETFLCQKSSYKSFSRLRLCPYITFSYLTSTTNVCFMRNGVEKHQLSQIRRKNKSWWMVYFGLWRSLPRKLHLTRNCILKKRKIFEIE